MSDKQTQKAGDNSQQLQAVHMTVINGIDEKRAREIFQEMTPQLRNAYTQEAFEIANSRVAKLENSLMPKMESIDGALEAFADPSFQLLLAEAQKTAASTERPADYELLSELLIHRFLKGEDRVVRTGINRAVEIVGDISDEALLGLTTFHSVSSFIPQGGDINRGLDTLNNLFRKVFCGKLPTGNDWLDHLDLLDAIRINSLGSLKKFEDYYPELLKGYVEVGIEINSENYTKAIELLKTAEIPLDILVTHALNENFSRLNIPSLNAIDSITTEYFVTIDGNLQHVVKLLTEKQKETLRSIFNLYKQDNEIKQENIKIFMDEWNKRPNLKILREWWNSIPFSIQLTSVGRVLAHSNAQRCDENLPPFP